MKHLFLLLILLFSPISIFAQSNNIYGIHLAQPDFKALEEARNLVNSTGGDWGYVTLVIQENDRSKEKWQAVFDKMRELHLIPIIRLATSPLGENWRRPEVSDAKDWVEFLDSLNWVIKERYIVLFNEPNHGSEWGGEVDEKSYFEVVLAFSKALKEKNKDFFVMMAGFDASAPSWPPGMEDEEKFLRKISSLKFINIFDYIDGWVSHSYPNPDFSGSPYDFGRGTVRTYQWEMNLLKNLGLKKNLPVFITETGWKKSQNSKGKSQKLITEDLAASYFQIAFQEVWSQDSQVKAVTPFILDYQGAPFLEFSWKKYQQDDFYKQYFAVQSLSKIKGAPEQEDKGKIFFNLPKELVEKSKYDFKITLKNQGQSIWDEKDGYKLFIVSNQLKNKDFLIESLKNIKPFEEKEINFSLKTDVKVDQMKVKFVLKKDDKVVLESSFWQFQVLPLPSLSFQVDFWPIGKGRGDDFEIQIFDIDERLVFKKKGVAVKDGKGMIDEIQNIALDELYRVVILKKKYLPRQKYIVFQKENNFLRFEKLLPFDRNENGRLDWEDLIMFL